MAKHTNDKYKGIKTFLGVISVTVHLAFWITVFGLGLMALPFVAWVVLIFTGWLGIAVILIALGLGVLCIPFFIVKIPEWIHDFIIWFKDLRFTFSVWYHHFDSCFE